MAEGRTDPRNGTNPILAGRTNSLDGTNPIFEYRAEVPDGTNPILGAEPRFLTDRSRFWRDGRDSYRNEAIPRGDHQPWNEARPVIRLFTKGALHAVTSARRIGQKSFGLSVKLELVSAFRSSSPPPCFEPSLRPPEVIDRASHHIAAMNPTTNTPSPRYCISRSPHVVPCQERIRVTPAFILGILARRFMTPTDHNPYCFRLR
jgi:hypothetical protein